MPSRLTPPFPPLDPAPLKDMARSLRFVAERGGRTLKEALPLDILPDPAARAADAALATLRKVGREADRSVSALAHALLDRKDPSPSLSQTADTGFAAAIHDGLRVALSQMGVESSLISETAAGRAWATVHQAGPGGKDSETAAALFVALVQFHAVREAIWREESKPLLPTDTARVAIFAVLLAMLADPSGHAALLPAATDLALALRGDLADNDDATALAALFEEFRNHV